MNPHSRGPRNPPLPATSLREEPNVVDLIAFREQLDRGEKVTVSLLFDGLGADPEPRLSPELANYVSGELEDMRSGGMAAAKALDGQQPTELHQRLMAVLAEIDGIQSQLAETVGGRAA